jgi:hypothetical protein
MNSIRLMAVAAAAALAVCAVGSAYAANKSHAPKYYVYKTEQGCRIVVNAIRKTPGKQLSGPFKSLGRADRSLAKMKKEKKC